MQDLPERPPRRAKGRRHTKAQIALAEGASDPRWTFAPELEAFMTRAATRPAPLLREMLIYASRAEC